jgi:nitroimidazol reductase NimA-like FMN-containing flavoprotein (pyridoxamine 5'-phosphate oxidase superfamily)/GNAT superfamily N-acetyltransferase
VVGERQMTEPDGVGATTDAMTLELDPGPVTMALRDGRSVLLRRLTDDDGDALIDAVHHADAFDLRRRFMGQPPPDHVLIQLLHAADGIHDRVLGAFDADGRIVGVTQFDRLDDEPAAEFAIEVASDWQRCGLGVAMLRSLGEAALSCGVTTFTAVYVADNTPIVRLMRSTGCARWLGTEYGASAAELDLQAMLLTSPITSASGPSPLVDPPSLPHHGAMSVDAANVTVLSRSQSMELLRSVPVGRIVFTHRALPAITPVNFTVLDNDDIVIRTAVGSRLAAATDGAVVAFEADSYDGLSREAWSVVVTGRAGHVVSDDELAEVETAMPAPWAAGERGVVVRVGAEIVDGRRVSGGLVHDGTNIPPQSGPAVLGTSSPHPAG